MAFLQAEIDGIAMGMDSISGTDEGVMPVDDRELVSHLCHTHRVYSCVS